MDRHAEDLHIEKALRDCGYPDWTFQKVKKQMKMKSSKRKQDMDSANRCLVVLPYVEGTSEGIARVMRKHQVPVAMRPVKTLKSLLVNPKDKQEKEEIIDCIYKIPCPSCEKCYIGETGRKFGTRLKEHKTEVESITSKPFTRNQRASSLSEQKLLPPFPQIDVIRAMMVVWRVSWKIIGLVLYSIVCNSCAQCNAHTYEQT